MNTIIVKTQQEFDALPDKFEQWTYIFIQNDASVGRIVVSVRRENSSVIARENSSVIARENSSVEARENSSVIARENSSVEAWGNSSVIARENSSVIARENSSVEAWGNSSVEARENSSVEAWGNSSVIARENSSVIARENSSVEAWGNSSVIAWGNSSVIAWENSGVHLHSDCASVILYMFAVCWAIAKGRLLVKKSETATIIYPKKTEGVLGWLESQGLKEDNGKIIIFKRVSSDLKTQEKTPNETTWSLQQIITCPSWKPEIEECGENKFHACSRPYFCDEFRSNAGDKYIAIEVKLEDMFIFPNAQYPHKVAFRSGKVLYICDRFGKEIK